MRVPRAQYHARTCIINWNKLIKMPAYWYNEFYQLYKKIKGNTDIVKSKFHML